MDVLPVIARMSEETRAYFSARDWQDPAIIGIQRGGVWVARILHQLLNVAEPMGALDIAFYRDDFTRIGLQPNVRPSNIPFDVENRHIILVDDVLYTGRTVKAALHEIYDYGRPASVTLVCLVDRAGRELPIQADIVGKVMTVAADQLVEVSGPEPLLVNVVAKQS